jgi:FlaA1/EpsC-like NDP-sugar epimerase
MLKTLIWLRGIHILVDGILLLGAFILAYFIQVGWIFSSEFPFGWFFILSLLGSTVWVFFLVFTKYYRIPPRSGKRAFFDYFLVILGGIVAVGFLIVIYFFPWEVKFSRFISLLIFFLGSSFLFISQILFRFILIYLKKQKKATYNTLIIGANRVGEKIVADLNNNPYALYDIKGILDPYGMTKKFKGAKLLGKMNKLEEVCANLKITAIIQCDAFEHTLNLISFCEEKDIKFQFDPALRGVYEDNLRIREVGGQAMISFVKRDFKNEKQRGKYRLIDSILRQVFDID